MLDLIAWKRPIQPLSYSVTRPQGAVSPTPAETVGLIGIAKYRLGTTFRLPASPPLPPSGCDIAATEPSSLNFIDGLIRWITPTTWRPSSLDIPAGLVHRVLASCAAAAPPAKALPRPEADVSLSWNPAPNAFPPAAATANPVIAWASGWGLKVFVMVVVSSFSFAALRGGCCAVECRHLRPA